MRSLAPTLLLLLLRQVEGQIFTGIAPETTNECFVAVNNDDARCAELTASTTEVCDCYNFCNGELIGCWDYGDSSSFTCKGEIVAGCEKAVRGPEGGFVLNNTIVGNALGEETETDNQTPTPAPTEKNEIGWVTDFMLVDIETNMDEQTVENFMRMPHGQWWGIRAVVANEDAIGSVMFMLDGQTARIENVAPYSLTGDTGGDYYEWNPFPSRGAHSLTAIPWSEPDAKGVAGLSLTIHITVP